MSRQSAGRISELKQPSAEFPRKFVPEDLDHSKWENLEPLFNDLLNREVNSREELERWIEEKSELNAVVAEDRARRYIAMTCATDDKEAEKSYLQFIEQIQPELKKFSDRLDRKLVECPFAADLDAERYEILLRSCRNSIELFRQENIALETELNKLSQRYQKIMGAMTVDFRGRERTLQEMGVFLEDNDRATRHEAFELSTNRRLDDKEKLEDIFDQMLALRGQIAKNAGFEDYRAYMFRRMERFDYTPEQCLQFHEAIEKIVVPLNREMLLERKNTLDVEVVKPWDMACDRYGRAPLKPFEDTQLLAVKCREIFGNVDAELGADFQKMIDLGLLDLGSRKGKAPGGYQSSLDELRLPFIFMNAVGRNSDIFVLLHEGGHSFHTFATRNEPLIEYRDAPIEFSEVASMTMEHLAVPYLTEFYTEADAARALYDHFEGDIATLAWIAIIDAFQHWIYTHPGHTREERAEYWLALVDRFGPGVDHSGYEESRKYRWHAQLHIFEVPFYYIEYGIALLGALQIWRNSLSDPAGALAAYKRGLALGGSRKLPELFESAGARFDFSAVTIQPLIEAVKVEMERLKNLEKT